MSPLTARHRDSLSTPRECAATTDRTARMETLARRLCQKLAQHRLDLAPVDRLARALAVGEPEVCATAAGTPYLGLCGTDRALLVFCLPPQPLTAGFLAEHRQSRLVLRLPAHGGRPPLLLSGDWLGPVPAEQRDETVGAGPLAHLVSRLVLMAASWLPPTEDPTRFLFELIVEAWHLGALCRGGPLQVYRGSFDRCVGRRHGMATNRLELVIDHQGGRHQLVNVYPIAAEGED